MIGFNFYMDKKVFKQFCDIIYNKSGIHLDNRKEALVEGRIAKRMRALKIDDYKDYLDIILKDENEHEISRMLDVVSTNVTHFYREPAHFEYLYAKMKEWIDNGQTRFRLWSAASSSGEEPYTMAMIAKEAQEGIQADLRILGTDISGPMLLRCEEALYSKDVVSKLPPKLKNTYMIKRKLEGEEIYEVSQEIRNLTLFKRLNLSKPPFPMKGPMDAIFIRNVMIYFDAAVKQRLVDDAYRLLKPGGILCIGHSESLTGLNHKFKTELPAAYRK